MFAGTEEIVMETASVLNFPSISGCWVTSIITFLQQVVTLGSLVFEVIISWRDVIEPTTETVAQ